MELNKIGIYIICYNEEHRLKRTLESIKWADEIVIVDCGSTDKTLDICKEYTNKIYIKEFKGFGEQKNYAKSLVTKEWAFNLDADEVISRELLIEINNIGIEDDVNGYYIPRLNYYLGKVIKRCGWYPDYKLRLHRKDVGRWQDAIVHESYIIEGNVKYMLNPILHFTYDNILMHLDKIRRYSQYSAEMILNKGRKIHIYHLLFIPVIVFFKKYILQLGFVEGYRGILISYFKSYYSLLKYAFAYEKRIKR